MNMFTVPVCNHPDTNRDTKVYNHIDTQRSAVLPYAALVFCEEHWLSLRERVGWECPLSEPSLPCEAKLQSLQEDQAGTCPNGCASPAAAIDSHRENPLNRNEIPSQKRIRRSQHFHMFASLQATKEFYCGLDELCMSRGADWPMNKSPSVPTSSPLNNL